MDKSEIKLVTEKINTINEFHLLSEKDLEPLADLIKKICT